MTELKVGDVVTVTGWETPSERAKWEGRTGTVYIADSQDAVCVEFKDGKQYSAGGWEARFLKKVEEPAFSFKDIQVGDKIRRTETWDSGSVRVFEGAVTKLDGLRAYTKEGLLVRGWKDHENSHVKLELLERPEPPHWTEAKPVGSVGIVVEGAFSKTLTKVSESHWKVLYPTDEYTWTGTHKEIQKNLRIDESKLTWIK